MNAVLKNPVAPEPVKPLQEGFVWEAKSRHTGAVLYGPSNDRSEVEDWYSTNMATLNYLDVEVDVVPRESWK